MYMLVLIYILICLINLDSSFGEGFVPMNVDSEKLCFLLESFPCNTEGGSVHFQVSALNLHTLAFKKLRNCRFCYTRTEVLLLRTILVAFECFLSFLIFQILFS